MTHSFIFFPLRMVIFHRHVLWPEGSAFRCPWFSSAENVEQPSFRQHPSWDSCQIGCQSGAKLLLEIGKMRSECLQQKAVDHFYIPHMWDLSYLYLVGSHIVGDILPLFQPTCPGSKFLISNLDDFTFLGFCWRYQILPDLKMVDICWWYPSYALEHCKDFRRTRFLGPPAGIWRVNSGCSPLLHQRAPDQNLWISPSAWGFRRMTKNRRENLQDMHVFYFTMKNWGWVKTYPWTNSPEGFSEGPKQNQTFCVAAKGIPRWEVETAVAQCRGKKCEFFTPKVWIRWTPRSLSLSLHLYM